MNKNEVAQAESKEDAIQSAIDWQHWVGEQHLSWGELAEWQGVFSELAQRFELSEEFKENGII